MSLLDIFRPSKLQRSGLPRELNGIWFAGNAGYSKKTSLIPYWNRRKYIDYNVGDVVPYKRTKFGIAHYRITGWERNGWGDYAGFDDGRKYDLIFDHFASTKTKSPSKESED